MAQATNEDGITIDDIDSTFAVLETIRQNLANDGMRGEASIINDAHYLVQKYENQSTFDEQSGEREHSFEVGDYAIDGREPTPSPEVNTVEVVELTHTPANEFETEEGKLVSEYEHNKFYPNDDLVVAGVYPNMSDDTVWHFPESRLRRA